jgi:hypothetical protein
VAVNFLQVFQVAFSTNFFTIFLDYFMDASQRPSMIFNNWFKSIIVTFSVLMPAVATVSNNITQRDYTTDITGAYDQQFWILFRHSVEFLSEDYM